MALFSLDIFCLLVSAIIVSRLGRFWKLTSRWLGGIKALHPLPIVQTRVDERSLGTKNAKLDMILRPVDLNKTEYGTDLEVCLLGLVLCLAAFVSSEVVQCFTKNSSFQGEQAGTTLLLFGVLIRILNTLRWMTHKMISNMANREAEVTLVYFVVVSLVTFATMLMMSYKGVSFFSLDVSAVIPDLDLWQALSNSSRSAHFYLWCILLILVPILAGIIAGLTLFSALRFGRLYNETIFLPIESKFVTRSSLYNLACWHFNLFLPFVAVILYIEPLVGEPIRSSFSLDERTFDNIRAIGILVICVMRLAFLPHVFRAFQNSTALVIEYMASNDKYSESEIISFASNQNRLSAYIALQYIVSNAIPLLISLLQKRVSGYGIGFCDMIRYRFLTALASSPPNARQLGIFADLSNKLSILAGLQTDANDSMSLVRLGNQICHVLLLSFHCFWFLGSVIGVLHFRSDPDALHRIAEHHAGKENEKTK